MAIAAIGWRTLRASATAIVIAATALIVRTVLWGGPSFLYNLRQPSISSQCGAIHAGMTLNEVETMVHSVASPPDESLTDNHFSFGSRDVCEVDLDPTTKHVTRAWMFQSSVRWPS
jgi:hypothetical protein